MTTASTPNIVVLRAALIKEFYAAEASGAVSFAAIEPHVRTDHQRRACRLLAEVESVTETALDVLMNRYQLARQPEDDRVRGEKWALSFAAGDDWPGFWTGFIPVTECWLGGMTFLRAIGAEIDRDQLDQLVEHEEALLEFARREVAGARDALAPLEQYLQIYRPGSRTELS